jgi:hypothetical protein
MGSTRRARRATRFEQVAPEQDRIIRGGTGKLVLTGRLRSWKGKTALRAEFEKALDAFQADVSGFKAAVALTDGFVLVCNSLPSNPSPRAFGTLQSQLRCGLLEFAQSNGLHEWPLSRWPANLAEQMVRWLRHDKNAVTGKPISASTARKRYGDFCALFAELGENERLAKLLPDLEPFPENPFSGAHGDQKKTKSLGLSVLVKMLRAARQDFLNAAEKVRYAQALFEGLEVRPDASKRGRGQFRELDAVLWFLHERYPKRNFPAFTKLRQIHPSVFWAINRLHGGWSNVAEYFYPLSASLVAPIVLLTIYGHFNLEPLRLLQLKQVTMESFLGGENAVLRAVVKPGKERASTPYTRSFAIDSRDPASPHSVLEFMKKWTEGIRKRAGKFRHFFFIGVTTEGEVKTFATAQLDARGSDSRWNHHFGKFCERNDLPPASLMELRQTSLDYVRQLTKNDIRALLAMKGGTSEAVVKSSYESDSAESRHNAAIAAMQANKERYIRTKGKIQHLGAPASQDLTAATPGCKCADPYSSPIPGEAMGVQCQAFGSCPGCPHGSPQLGSAYSLARLLQLREALIDAKSRIRMERWIARYKKPLEVLESKWIPMFDDPKIWKKVGHMSLYPIGVIE